MRHEDWLYDGQTMRQARERIEALVRADRSMKEVAAELGWPYNDLSNMLKRFYPETKGRFTDLRMKLGLPPYKNMTTAVLKDGYWRSKGSDFWAVPA